MQKNEYFKNIDLLRFLFASIIVWLHSVGCMHPLDGAASFDFLFRNCKNMSCVVELFFVTAGFFFILGLDKHTGVLNFIKSKFLRLWPMLAFTVLLFAIASIFGIVKFYTMDNIFSLLFLNGIMIVKHSSPYGIPPYGLGNVHSSWFISVLVCLLTYFFYFIKNFGIKLFNLFIIVFIVLGLYWISCDICVCIHPYIIRGIYSIGIGCLLGQLYVKYKDKIKELKVSLPVKIFFTIGEIGIFVYLFFGLCFSSKDKLVMTDLIFLFVILFSLFIIKQGFFSKLLDNNFSVLLGKYSYPIFISHNFLLEIFVKYYWTVDTFTKFKNIFCNSGGGAILIYTALPVIVNVIFGILLFYIADRPISKLVKKYL